MSSDCSDDDMPELESVSSSEVSWLILLYNYIKINKLIIIIEASLRARLS